MPPRPKTEPSIARGRACPLTLARTANALLGGGIIGVVAEGDIEALLLQRDWLLRLASALMGDRDDAEDAVQTTMAVAVEHGLPANRPASSWLVRVLRNAIRMGHRSRLRRERRERDAMLLHDHEPPTPEQILERARAQEILARAIVKLPDKYRKTLLLRYERDLDTWEVAEIEGVSQATVRWRIHQALGMLRDQLKSIHEDCWLVVAAPFGSAKPIASTSSSVGGIAMKKLGGVLGVALLGTAAVVVHSATDEETSAPVVRELEPRASASSASRAGAVLAGSEAPRIRDLRREVAAAEARVAALEGELEEIRARGETVEHLVTRCRNGGFDCPSENVPQELLEAWAECGTLRAGGASFPIGDEDAARLGLTEQERKRIFEIGLAIQEADEAFEEELAREATGEKPPEQPGGAWIVGLNAHEVRDATLDPEEIRRKLAREAAGLEEPPHDPDSGPAYERLLRRQQSRGRRIVEAVERELGADRARGLEEILMRHSSPGGGTCSEP